jgi:hypothetical protein
MSDGPYKSLKMSRPWKRLAKIATNPAHSAAEVAEAYRPALLDDWRSVRPAFIQEVRAALGDGDRGELFAQIAYAEIQRLRTSAGNPMEALLAAQACDMARDGQIGKQAYEGAVKSTLEERAIQRAFQMEEHYLREGSRAAGPLRAKLNTSIGQIGADRLAEGIASGAAVRNLAPKVDRSSLDDGVPL